MGLFADAILCRFFISDIEKLVFLCAMKRSKMIYITIFKHSILNMYQ